MLKAALHELSIESFQSLLKHILNVFQQDPDFQAFGRYFKSYYSSNYENWEFCYRIGAKINTNGHIKSMHRVIKHVYLEKRHCLSLEKALKIFMEFIRDKTFDNSVTV